MSASPRKNATNNVHMDSANTHGETKNYIANMKMVPYKIGELFGFLLVMDEDDVMAETRRNTDA